jgi:hypothetical protein
VVDIGRDLCVIDALQRFKYPLEAICGVYRRAWQAFAGLLGFRHEAGEAERCRGAVAIDRACSLRSECLLDVEAHGSRFPLAGMALNWGFIDAAWEGDMRCASLMRAREICLWIGSRLHFARPHTIFGSTDTIRRIQRSKMISDTI